MPLPEALDDLRCRGVNLIFSSDLVCADMVVGVEVPAGDPRETLDRLLAPFGLAAMEGPAGTILVVRASPGPSGADHAPDGEGNGPPAASRPMLRERIRVGPPGNGGPGPVTSLEAVEIARAGPAGDDLARALQRLPGVVSAENTARFGIRGGRGDETLILLDGFAIDEPYHLKDFLAFSSIVDARAVGRVDVRTGIFPAEYGDRLGGVVDMSTSDAAGPARTIAGVSLHNAGYLSSGGFREGGSWLISGRSWRPDGVVDTVSMDGEGIGPSYNDLLGKVRLRLPGGSFLSAHVLATQDNVRFQTDARDDRVAAHDDRRHVWATWKTPWNPRLYSETLASKSQVARARKGGTSGGQGESAQVDDARTYSAVGLKQDWILDAGPRSLLKWGFDLRRIEGEYGYRSHVERPDTLAGAGSAVVIVDRDLVLEHEGTEVGAYVASQLRIAAPLTAEIGVRRDRQSLTAESETSPRVNVSYEIGERSVVRAGWGVFHQAQGVDDLQVEDGVVDFFPAQRAEQWEVDLAHRFAAGWRLEASAYLRASSDLRPRYENLFDPFPLFPESEPDRVRVAPDAAEARGVEIALAGRRGAGVDWRASYSWATARDRIDDAWVPRSMDQRHTFRFGLTCRRADRWIFDLLGAYHSGWPTTDIRAEQEADAGGSPVIRPIHGPRNALRLPAYHRLDLGVTRRFGLSRGTLGLRFQVTNLYGRDNVYGIREIRYVPQADGTVRVERSEARWQRQRPWFAVTYEF